MMPFLDKFGMVGSAGQSPVAFPCSFAASLPATASILQTGGGVTSAPGTPDLLAASDSGASATDNVTSDTTPAFRVGLPAQAIAGDTVRVYRAGSTEIGSAALDAGDVTAGFVDVTAAALSAGGHSITARVENGAGLSPSSAGLAIAVDAAAPDAPIAVIVAPADQGSGTLQTDDTQPTFRISLPANAVAGDAATLEIDTVDDATAALIAGDIANGYVDIQSASVLADDTLYDISAYITDIAGNQGASSAAAEVEVGDASGDAIPAVVYDGVQGFLKHTGGPVGAADGAALTVAWAGTFNSDGSAMTLLDIPGSVPVKLTRNADDTILFEGGAAGAVFENATAAVAASLGFLIVLASCDGTAATLKVVHAAGTITGTNAPGSAASLDLTADWFLGADGGAAEFLDADTALWWIASQAFDFTDADSIEQFWDTTADTLRDPGATGANPLDGAASPLVCHKSSAASHTVNVGTGGDADTAGVFADGTSPGSYAGDFVPAASATIEYVTTVNNNANQSSYTFTSVSIGAAALGSKLLIVVFWGQSVAVPQTATCMVDTGGGGVSATQHVAAVGSNGNGRTRASLFTIDVGSVTTADIVVAGAGMNGSSRCAVSVYRGDFTETPTDMATNETTGGSTFGVSLDIPADGVAILAASGTADTTLIFSGISERHDAVFESVATYGSASDAFPSGATGASLSATFGSAPNPVCVAALSFGPP